MKLRIVTGILAVMVIALVVAYFFKANNVSEASYWRKQASDLQEEKFKLETQLKESRDELKQNETLTKKVKKLQKEKDELSEEVDELQSKLNGEPKTSSKSNSKTGKKFSAEEIVNLFFWKAEKPYEMRDQEFNFYSDPSCKKKYIIRRDLTFVNSFDYELVDPDTKEKFYASMSLEKGIVFSRERPFFDKME